MTCNEPQIINRCAAAKKKAEELGLVLESDTNKFLVRNFNQESPVLSNVIATFLSLGPLEAYLQGVEYGRATKTD